MGGKVAGGKAAGGNESKGLSESESQSEGGGATEVGASSDDERDSVAGSVGGGPGDALVGFDELGPMD